MIAHSSEKKQLLSQQNNEDVKTGVGNTRLNSQEGGLGEGTTPTLPGQSPDLQAETAEPPGVTEAVKPDRVEAKPDWANFIGDIEMQRLPSLFSIIEEFTDEKLHLTGKPRSLGTKTFKYSGRSPNSLVIGWGDANEDINKVKKAQEKAKEKAKEKVVEEVKRNRKTNREKRFKEELIIDEWLTTECLVSIPGRVLSAMSAKKIHTFFGILVAYGFHCSKLDIAVDDFGKRLKLDKIIAALKAKNRTKFTYHRVIEDSNKGFTIYMGTAESARMTKFYDKDIESKGKIKSYRLETRFNNKIAHDVLLNWLSINQKNEGWEKDSANYLIKSVVGSIDFRDRESKPGEKNLGRLKRLDWWQEFINELGIDGVICHSAPIPKTSLERATNWMKRSVMRRLTCLLTAFQDDGEAWLMQRLQEAKLSLKERHHVDIEQYSREYAQHKTDVDYGFSQRYIHT